jgi:hypothetical protein
VVCTTSLYPVVCTSYVFLQLQKSQQHENKAIVLPDGAHAQATPGKYKIVPPPDLNEVVERRFLLEYDFPFLLVQEMATRQGSEKEKGESSFMGAATYRRKR